MPKQPNKKLIGLFIILGFLLFLSLIGKVLSDKFFENDDNLVVMYFDESVKGLNVGSPVVFKGVEIGKVTKIELIADPYNLDFSIPVFARLTANQDLRNKNISLYRKRTSLNAFIKKGLRARLVTQSYLTGQLMVELEMLPDTPIHLEDKGTGRNAFEIPTVLSPIGELSKGFQDLPFRQTLEKFNTILDELEQDLPQILPKLAELSENLNNIVKKNGPTVDDTMTNLNKTIYEIGDAAKALRNFADYIERHPEALLKGKGGY